MAALRGCACTAHCSTDAHRHCASQRAGLMHAGIAQLNEMESAAFERAMLACCGSHAWAEAMRQRRPFADVDTMLRTSDEVWFSLTETDWLEAFATHPRIGDRKSAAQDARAAAW